MTFEYMETDDLIVMLGDFMLPSVKANGGINICTWRPWSDIVDYVHMHVVIK